MTNAPKKPFGFVYGFAGKRYAFDLLASTPEEAQARIAALAQAEFVGELRCDSDTTADSPAFKVYNPLLDHGPA